MSEIIKLTIQEIVNDFYSIGEENGYLTGLSENFSLSEKDKKSYHDYMKNMINKYIPDWKHKINKEYFNTNELDEKGLIIHTLLYKNFKEIFEGLI